MRRAAWLVSLVVPPLGKRPPGTPKPIPLWARSCAAAPDPRRLSPDNRRLVERKSYAAARKEGRTGEPWVPPFPLPGLDSNQQPSG